MIETCRLKNGVIFIQEILSFVLSRKIINNDIKMNCSIIKFNFYSDFIECVLNKFETIDKAKLIDLKV